MSAGELSEHFPVSKPTMSAHFSVLQQADLIEAEKSGRTILYRLKMSVLEEALLGFAQTLGWKPKTAERTSRLTSHSGQKRRPIKSEV
jgi:DNA-binding transcriptional ArsR family regulator